MNIRKRPNLGLGIFFRKNNFSQLIRKLNNFHVQFFSKFTIKSKNGQKWPKMTKNGQKQFLEKNFLLFFHHISKANSL